MPRPEFPSKFRRVLDTKARIIVLIGGRDSAKSTSVAQVLLGWSQAQHADVMCGREYMTSIDDSVHKLLRGLIKKLEIKGVRSTDKKIDFDEGGGFRYKGFARNASAVRESYR